MRKPRRGRLLSTHQRKSTVTTHAVAGDTDAAGIQLGESLEDNFWQFLGDVAVHVIALVVGSLGGINVEARAGTKIIRIILALDVQTS